MTHTPTPPQPDTTDDLDQLFYRELRGKTVTPEQQRTLEWAQRRLIPALKARDTRRETEARIRALNDARSIVWAIGYDDDPTAILLRNKIWEMMQATEATLKEKTKDE